MWVKDVYLKLSELIINQNFTWKRPPSSVMLGVRRWETLQPSVHSNLTFQSRTGWIECLDNTSSFLSYLYLPKALRILVLVPKQL